MSFELTVLAIISVLELAIWLPLPWRGRKILAGIVIVVLSLCSGLLFGGQPAVWTALVLVGTIYRLINLLRLLEGRMQAIHLLRVTRLTSWWLIGAQILVVGIHLLDSRYRWLSVAWPHLLTGFQLATAALLWMSTRRSLRTTRPPERPKRLDSRELPTLSVAIPARNETDELEACLQSLVSSDYPKLEILVLDDCSQNQRTPGIIRDFAQSGVRFIAGQTPPRHWLAKNYAYEQLAAAANGEILLFCGVDARFRPDSLRSMVEVMLAKRKSMISFLPRNPLPAAFSLEPLMVQPARYAWELSLPRRLLNRPPVLSTCWLITAAALNSAGGFEAVIRSIAPESYFARRTARQHDGYSFTQSDRMIDLSSAKSLTEQRATAIRTRYPQLHRRPELTALLSLAELTVLVLPLAMLIIDLATAEWLLAAGNLATVGLLTDFYGRIVALTYRRRLARGLWIWPLTAIYDIGLLNYSMWRYEFREVIWKDRNVCIPVMRTIPGSGKTR